jgi:FKBP-type peptidyl-prolyl cis-trans isomerase 2
MNLQKKDFIEIKFTGRIKDGEVFDSNIKEDLENLNSNANTNPLIFCLGENMFLKGIDEFLVDKKIGEYKIELSPEKAFGNRDSNLIQMIPLKVFKEQKVNPVPGAIFNFDGKIAKILTASGGRVMVDFNNPLAGKTVVYDIKVLRRIEDLNEKVKALIDFFTRKEFKFEIKDKKLLIYADKQFAQFLNLFKDKFKDILDLELEVKEVEIKNKK